MSWGGFNMDDAVIISDRLVKTDMLTTSIQKIIWLKFVKPKPNEGYQRYSKRQRIYCLRHLDEDGIVQIGSEVKPGDVLVGKNHSKRTKNFRAKNDFACNLVKKRKMFVILLKE